MSVKSKTLVEEGGYPLSPRCWIFLGNTTRCLSENLHLLQNEKSRGEPLSVKLQNPVNLNQSPAEEFILGGWGCQTETAQKAGDRSRSSRRGDWELDTIANRIRGRATRTPNLFHLSVRDPDFER